MCVCIRVGEVGYKRREGLRAVGNKCVALCCSVLQERGLQPLETSVLQCAALCCSVLHCVAGEGLRAAGNKVVSAP